MKTTQNALSIWRFEEEAELADAIVAATANADRSSFDTVDFVILQQEDLEARGLTLEEVRGNTLYEEFAERHLDIVELNAPKLLEAAESISDSLRDETKRIRYTKVQLSRLFSKAIDQGKISVDELHEDLREKLPD